MILQITKCVNLYSNSISNETNNNIEIGNSNVDIPNDAFDYLREYVEWQS